MSVIKPAEHRKGGTPGGVHRARMTERDLKRLGDGRRWPAETFMSGMKPTLNATSERGPMRDAGMKMLAYAIRR